MAEDRKLIDFNGVQVVPWWPAHLQRSQRKRHYRIAGQEYARVVFCAESDDWGADRGPCHDCAALKGQFHALGCDVERCPVCDGQPFGCGCDYDEPEPEAPIEEWRVAYPLSGDAGATQDSRTPQARSARRT